jgi:hypothetical protein
MSNALPQIFLFYISRWDRIRLSLAMPPLPGGKTMKQQDVARQAV